MKILSIAFFFFIININMSHAQIEVGLMHDLKGVPLNGYFDPIIFSSQKTVYSTPIPDSYELGHYYDSSGVKINGLIKFDQKKIFYKKNKNDKKITIEAGKIKSLIVGVDSFIVVKEKLINNVNTSEPQFVKYLASFDNYIFAKHYHFFSNMQRGMGAASASYESYLVKHKDSLIWDKFSTETALFKYQAMKYFGHIEPIKAKIEANKYSEEEMESILKMAEYYYKHKNFESIYYDIYWQETRNVNRAVYFAKIIDYNNSSWTLAYSNKDYKLYQAKYTSFSPNEKEGEFSCYYPNGNLRQVIFYVKNKPTEVKIYNTNGVMISNFQFVKGKDNLWSEPTPKIKYLVFLDTLGNDILKNNPNASVNITDHFNHETYTYRFENNELVSCYKLLNGDSIFHSTDINYNFDDEKLQEKFISFIKDKNYDEAVSENAQGTILVSLLMDADGNPLKYNILNKLHPQLDSLVEQFIKIKLSPTGASPLQLKAYKKGKLKRSCEILIPFEFSINRFYREPVNYSHFYQNHWQIHQHMINNNMMMHHSAPSMRMGF